MLDLCDIVAGAIAYLDPKILEAHGVFCPRWPWDRIQKPRPYVCVWTDGTDAIFVAMSSKPGTYWHPRLLIPRDYRIGSQEFRETEQHVCGDGNVYEGPLRDFQAASKPDHSWRGNRSRIHEDFLPHILSFAGLEHLI